MADVVDLLARPTYGLGQADRLLGLKPGTARRWIDGYRRHGTDYPPVVRSEPTGDELVTWGEFIETRLLSEFRDQGVPLVRLRPVVVRLREQLATPYPLAVARPFVVDRELVAAVQDDVGLARSLRLVELRTGQVLLTEPAARFFDQVAWGADQEAARLHPLGPQSEVTLDPLHGFGEPTVRGIRTEILAEFFRAGERTERLADMYDLPSDAVEDALRFELSRSAAA